MPVITLTKREVKNKSGIDVSVASYESAASAKQVKDYHVVVITNLPFFKLPEHSKEDTVQLMVPRDYPAFEKLQRDILISFPELKLPAFPRRFHVFMDESDVEERMISFDCIVKLISRDSNMCTSAAMLEFLGFELLSDRKYYKARREYLQKKEEAAQKKEKAFRDLGDTDQELFGTEEVFSDDSQTKDQPFTADSIFEESGGNAALKKSAKISMLKDEEALFLPGEGRLNSAQAEPSSLLENLEDNSELLNVTDSLDDVLKITDKKKQPKKVAPLASSGVARGLFEVEDGGEEGAVDMGTDDIMKYIQQNQAANDDDLDLF